ncbi:hypothetical protein [Kocuria palustris]|uniref:hypothetical protein n=1 Tax=Kocuria palustris TaxID=71999 RepID=UPI00119CBFBF|nr:hypothetical protein [Kocuria palustris]
MAPQLRYRTLFAGTALAALALSGCVQDPDGGEGGSEPSEGASQASPAPESGGAEPSAEEASSAESSEPAAEPSGGSSASSEASASDAASGPAAGGEAPEDISEGDLTTLLSTEVDGTQLIAVTPSQLEASGMDLEAEMAAEFGEGFEVSPATCEGPFMNALLGGMHDSGDAVIAVDDEGSLLITARTFDDAQGAEEALDEQRGAVDECGEVEVTVEGQSSDSEMTTEDLAVDGASAAYETTLEIEGDSVANPSMAYGNTLISMVETSQFEGGPAPDNEALLEEVAGALSES